MRAKITDIARIAECSITTVSLVLNNKPNTISEKKKRQILDVAQQLNYFPNRQAASLVTKKTKSIGLIIPDNCNTFFGSLSKEIETFAHDKGYNIIYGNSRNESANDYNYVVMFLERCVDGIIIVKSTTSNDQSSENLIKLLQSCPIPLVVLDRAINGVTAPTYTVDNRYGGYIATKHLVEQGHRRIACYSGPLNVSSALERLKGYRQAIEEAGIPYDPALVFEGNYQLGSEELAFEHFEKQNVTAIFAQNDIMAYGLYRQIQNTGKKIPQDYALVGFDDLDLSTIITPTLTSVRQPVERLGKTAIARLLSMIQDEEYHQDEEYSFPPMLIVRDSSKSL